MINRKIRVSRKTDLDLASVTEAEPHSDYDRWVCGTGGANWAGCACVASRVGDTWGPHVSRGGRNKRQKCPLLHYWGFELGLPSLAHAAVTKGLCNGSC